MNSTQLKILGYIGEFLNYIIPKSDDLKQPINLQILYIPILNEKDIIIRLFDGLLFCILINLIESNFNDMRAINQPKLNNLKPLSTNLIVENMRIVLSSIKSLNINMPCYNIKNVILKKYQML